MNNPQMKRSTNQQSLFDSWPASNPHDIVHFIENEDLLLRQFDTLRVRAELNQAEADFLNSNESSGDGQTKQHFQCSCCSNEKEIFQPWSKAVLTEFTYYKAVLMELRTNNMYGGQATITAGIPHTDMMSCTGLTNTF